MRRQLTESEAAVVKGLWEAKSQRSSTIAFCTSAEEVTLHKWNQRHPVKDNTADVKVPAGTILKIVMISRFGDIGLTDDLEATHGYHLRVEPDSESIKDIRWVRQETSMHDADDAWDDIQNRDD